MKLTVLVDNNTLIGQYFLAEPGLSFLVESEGYHLLFDTGHSGIFLENAQKMGVSLAELDAVVISHGHHDHTWGLEALARHYVNLQLQKLPHRRPKVVTHPSTLASISSDSMVEMGPLFSVEKLSKHFPVECTKGTRQLTPQLLYLGEIPRKNDFEGRQTLGCKEGESHGDTVPEDSALVYRGKNGLVIISGCSHSGICNIVEYAKEVCNDSRIVDIVGGLHLQNPSEQQLQGTLHYLRSLGLRQLHACHCTDLRSKIALATVAHMEEVGVGLTLNYE
jgi:7,8-dihydropterin-6-yl-methyl-4-(beta-D-ribofuranosyl)aminobenzene 5'-phosphate synthase